MIPRFHSSVARAFAGLAALALLAACATPTLYAPAGEGGFGYREQRIESDRYIVTFSGNSATDPDGVADAAMRRAADLTLEQGYEWFQIVSRNSDVDLSSGGSGMSVGVGGVSGSRGSSVGTSVAMSFPLGGGGAASTTSLEIRMGRGEHAADPSIYDAEAVARSLAGAPATP
jgi:hypothetical protein